MSEEPKDKSYKAPPVSQSFWQQVLGAEWNEDFNIYKEKRIFIAMLMRGVRDLQTDEYRHDAKIWFLSEENWDDEWGWYNGFSFLDCCLFLDIRPEDFLDALEKRDLI